MDGRIGRTTPGLNDRTLHVISIRQFWVLVLEARIHNYDARSSWLRKKKSSIDLLFDCRSDAARSVRIDRQFNG
jgi:hypothetical protein